MHDDLLERRLGAALHDEAGSLPFTITTAELERRMALRRQSVAGRRLALFLAAAVAIGLFGIGGAIGGLFHQPLPTASESNRVVVASPHASLPISSEPAATPPIRLAQAPTGWRLSGSLGPDLAPETRTMSLSGAGAGEDHIQVGLACTGAAPIEVAVVDAITQTFSATCTPDGNTTVMTFHVTEQGVTVRYVAPKGAWTALSVLVPSK
jgi:hypothetical protein